jgi:hypothetical protein
MADFTINDDGSFEYSTQSRTRTRTRTRKKQKEEKWYDEYFKESQGNGWQTFGYSALDALGNLTEGSLRAFEGISDWGRNRGADIVDFFGADEYAKELRERSKEDDTADIVKQWNHITAGDISGTKSEEEIGHFKKVEENSIFGDKSDQVFQGVGNSLTSIGVGALSGGTLSTPSFVLSAAGNAETEALNDGATAGEARMYGLISGAIEYGTERLFGGLGKTSEKFGLGKGALDDQAVKLFTKNMKSSLMKNITTLGIKSVGEGLEEVASGIGNAFAQKITYMDEEEIGQLLKDQNLMDSFVNGMLSSALMQGPSTITSTVQGRDVNTGLTRTQQQYVNEIAQQRMVEAQRRNARLNGYEKGKIEDRALTDFQKGRLANASQLQQVNLPGLSNKDMDLQQSAYKYGINPNSEFVVTTKTMLDNRGIKSRFDADAFKNINGNAYWTNKNGVREVVFNPNASEQAILEEIAIHELTHDLMSSENSKGIIENQNIIDYVKTLDGYKKSKAKLEKLYSTQTEGMSKKKATELINEEIIADTLGKNIGSQEYIRRLIDDEPSIAKNIYDWVVNKVANKNGVKNEKAYWNNVKNNFEKAYNMEYQGKGSKKSNNQAKYKIVNDKKYGRHWVVETEKDIFKGKTKKELPKSAFDYILNGNTNFETITDTLDGKKVKFIRISAKEYTRGRNSQNLNPNEYQQKMRLAPSVDDLINNAEIQYHSPLTHKNNMFKDGFNNYQGKVKIDDTYFRYIVRVGKAKNDNIFYDISLENLDTKKEANAVPGAKSTSPLKNLASRETNVPQSNDNVKSNQKYSLSDNKGYHYGDLGKGNDTYYWNMSQTRRSTGHFGTGTYFFGNEAASKTSMKSENRPLHEVDFSGYNLFKPSNTSEAIILHEGLKALNNIDRFVDYYDEFDRLQTMLKKYGISEQQSYEAFYNTRDVYFSDEYRNASYDSKLDSLSTIFMKELGYNGIDVRGIDKFDNGSYGSVIYDLDNKKSDTRYSLTDSEGRELTKEQQEWSKNSKARDYEGKLMVLYHGGKATTEFTRGNGEHGKGFYFTPDLDYANEFADGEDRTLTEAYLKLDNPLEQLNSKNRKELSKFIDFVSETYDIPKAEVEKMMSSEDWTSLIGEQVALKEGHTYQKVANFLGWDIQDVDTEDTNMKAYLSAYAWEETLNPKARELGYDGIISRVYNANTEYEEYIAFYSNQIKNVDNTNPTDNADIRYSLSVKEANTGTDNKGNKLSKGMQNYMKDSKATDENGNLIQVFHTTTDKVAQFNEFNPVGTDYYRFGDQVVNYYTDSKEMSGSYANQKYDVADTKKLNSMEEAKEWLEDNRFANEKQYDYDIKTTQSGFIRVILYDYASGNTITGLDYSNESELLRKLKRDVNGNIKDIQRQHRLQYQGYVNITNPYIVDADGQNWDSVKAGIDPKIIEQLNKITAEEKKALTQLAKESVEMHKTQWTTETADEWFIYRNKFHDLTNTEQDRIVYHRLGMQLDNPDKEVHIEGWVGSRYVDRYETLETFANKYDELAEYDELYRNEISYFQKNYKNILNTNKIEDINSMELFEIAHWDFSEDYYASVFEKDFSTNDVVFEVLEKNKNGANYDGVIIKNVVDYGGKSDTREPANLYITFASNQFKAKNNTNPTGDADIRYSLSEDTFTKFTDKSLNNKNIAIDQFSESVEIGTIKTNKGEILKLSSQEYNSGYGFIRKIVAEKENGKEAVLSFKQKGTNTEEFDYKNDEYVKKYHTYEIWHLEGAEKGDNSGTTLLNELIKEAKENGVSKIVAHDTTHNLDGRPSKTYWEKQGFVSNGEGDHVLEIKDADIRYSLSESGLKQLAEKTGTSFSSLEANLSYENEYGIKRYLTKHTDIVKKYMEDNNISVEPVYKEMEFSQLKTDEIKQFVIDNDLDVMKIANDEKMLNQYMDLLKKQILDTKYFTEEETNGVIEMWRGYFELAKHDNEVPRVLKSIDREFEAVKSGTTQVIDNIETDRKIQKEVIDSPSFQKYLDSLVKPLFDKPNYSADEVMEEAIYNHGTTDDYETGAYMTLDGQLLDFNSGGYRDDHRTISAFGVDMNEFMNYGAIRMQPETPGFEMNVEPTSEQYSRLYDYIDYLKETRTDNISIDIDKGNSYDSATYNINTPTSKIISDLKEYWRTGSFPKQSQFAEFRYSLSKQNEGWQSFLDKNFESKGTKTRLSDIKLPGITNTVQEEVQTEVQKSLLPIANELKELNKNLNKVLNPNEISQLTPQDASTTPNLPGINRNRVGDGRSSFFDNINNKVNMLNDEQKAAILSSNDVKYYDKVTNKDSLDKAYARLQENGQSESLRWFNKASESADATDVAEGWILLKHYADSGDTNGMVEVAKKLRDMGTKAGQTVQAFNILSRLTPEGMVKYAQSELLEAYDQMVKNKSAKWIEENRSKFDLQPNEVAFIMNTMQEVSMMEDGYDKRFKLAQIQKVLTDKLPPAKGAGIKAWMRISMLFNPKTQVRNVAGNAVIAPVNAFGDMFASLADKVIGAKTGVRTTGNTNWKNYAQGMKTGLYQSYNDFKNGVNTRNIEGNRFEVTEGKSFNDNNPIGKALNKVDSLLSFMLDAGDRGFYEASFVNSINNQMVLNNTTEVTQDMIDIATQEALSRTWQDNNEYTKFVMNVRNGLNKLNIGGYGLGDVLIPFAKTPANLTKAIVEYSPVGLIGTINKGIKLNRSLTNGQYSAKTQHEFVQSLGKATAGTMLYILGIALANAGVTTGESDEDKDVSNFMKNTLGVNSYSIKIGDMSFTYDWAQPLAAPLAITANLVQKQKEEASLLENVVSTLDTAGNLLLEQSFMESISTVLNNNEGIATGMQEAILDLPARAIPTFLKQITDLTDGTQRQTFVKDKPIESMFNSMKAKIPGLSYTLDPSVDTMGREIKKYGGKNNLFNVFLNPANVSTENVSESAQEIYRLYKETGETNIMPRVAPYYVNKKGEKIILTTQQRTQYQKVSGAIIEENVANLLGSTAYQNMSDTKKAETINDIVNYSYNIAQMETLGTELSETYETAYEYAQIGDISDFYEFRNSIDDTDADTKRTSIVNYLYNSDLEDNQIANLYGNYYSSDKTINAMLELRIPMREFIKFNSADIQGQYNSKTGQTISGSKKNATIEFVNTLNLSKAQRAILVKSVYSSYKNNDNDIVRYVNTLPGTANEKKVWLKSIGFDNYDDDVFNYINSQNISKEEKIKKLKELGFTVRNGRVYY